MANPRIPNKNTALVLNQKVSEGVDKYLSKVKSITLDGTAYTPKSLKDELQAEDDAAKSVDSTRAQLKQEVATHRKAKALAVVLRTDLRNHILVNYGKAAVQMLADFGMSAPKTTGNKTAETKAEAVVKARATRKTRSSVSKKPTAIASSQPATTDTPSQGAPAVTPAPVAQAPTPAQNIAHS